MSSVRKRDRFFALMGALLFLGSASALTIAVIYDSVTKKNADQSATTSQQTSCEITTAAAATVDLPKDYIKTDDTVTKLDSEDISVGTGKAAKSGDCLTMKYYGTLAKDGKVFDQNFDQSVGLQFELGSGQVIPGWDQGVVGMKVGGLRRLVIPSDLAYGDTGQGDIPAKATLVFLVKLVDIK